MSNKIDIRKLKCVDEHGEDIIVYANNYKSEDSVDYRKSSKTMGKLYYSYRGMLHRRTGPAMIEISHSGKTRGVWYQYGELHRKGDPAMNDRTYWYHGLGMVNRYDGHRKDYRNYEESYESPEEDWMVYRSRYVSGYRMNRFNKSYRWHGIL